MALRRDITMGERVAVLLLVASAVSIVLLAIRGATGNIVLLPALMLTLGVMYLYFRLIRRNGR